MIDLVGHAQVMQAAVIRGAPREEVERMRSVGHDKLDAYLDLMTGAATQVRTIFEP